MLHVAVQLPSLQQLCGSIRVGSVGCRQIAYAINCYAHDPETCQETWFFFLDRVYGGSIRMHRKHLPLQFDAVVIQLSLLSTQSVLQTTQSQVSNGASECAFILNQHYTCAHTHRYRSLLPRCSEWWVAAAAVPLCAQRPTMRVRLQQRLPSVVAPERKY